MHLNHSEPFSFVNFFTLLNSDISIRQDVASALLRCTEQCSLKPGITEEGVQQLIFLCFGARGLQSDLAQSSSANLEMMSKTEQAARQCKQVPKWELRYITNRGV